MDFVRTYGIPTRFDDAVRTALEGTTRTIDVGRVSYREWSGAESERYVANVGSVGMSAAVAQRANGMSKALGGKATFFYALTRVFFEWENTLVSVQLDDETPRGAHARRDRRQRAVARRRDAARAGGAAGRRPVRRRADRRRDEARLRHDGAEALQGHVSRRTRRSSCCARAPSPSTRRSACRSSSTASRSERRRSASRSSPPRCACVSRRSAALLAGAFAALAALVAAGAFTRFDQWAVDHLMPGASFHHGERRLARGARAAPPLRLGLGVRDRGEHRHAAGVLPHRARDRVRVLARRSASRSSPPSRSRCCARRS